LRVHRDVGQLRRRDAYRALRGAVATCLGRAGFRIVHVSIQSNHIHLLIEADHKRELSNGVRAFMISATRRLNALRGRSGTVFPQRYHAVAITSPKQARAAFASHHRSHRVASPPTQLQQQKCLVAPIEHFPSWKAVFRQMPAEACDGEKYVFCGCTARQLDAPEARFVYRW
jgi:REP element-mobilizing transposase RayT